MKYNQICSSNHVSEQPAYMHLNCIKLPPHPSLINYFNTVQVISRLVVFSAKETSTYNWSRFCTVNYRPSVSNFQLFHSLLQSGLTHTPPPPPPPAIMLPHLNDNLISSLIRTFIDLQRLIIAYNSLLGSVHSTFNQYLI